MTQEQGMYIYGIVAAGKEEELPVKGIVPDYNAEIICREDIGAVVSPSPVKEYDINRKNTLAHQKVMEKAMETYNMLPVRFGTIAENTDVIRTSILEKRGDEIRSRLRYIEGKVELGVKVMWKDSQAVFREILSENKKIRQFKERLNSRRGGMQKDRVRLGEMVLNALDEKQRKRGEEMLDFFGGLFVEHKANRLISDRMILNSVFLVEKDREGEFDRAVERLDRAVGEELKINYVGPVPPCNFVELVVTL